MMRLAAGEPHRVSARVIQKALGSPASRRMPFAVWRDLIFTGTVNGLSVRGLIHTS